MNTERNRLGKLLGGSRVMRAVYERIEKAAASNITVLLTGASGTGKELVAREIHDRSGRRRGPFVPVNAGAIPRELTASELFGTEVGAYTGATVQRKGKFELANGGTLFLDEIAATDHTTQVTLLRALEDRTVVRLGGRNPIHLSVRFIAATNEHLNRAIRQGRFREDLYYRLDIFQIHLPTLRERGPDDILLLARAFLAEMSRETEKEVRDFTSEARMCLLEYAWPGNVRELKNGVMRAVVETDAEKIGRKDLPRRVQDAVPVTQEIRFKLGRNLRNVERAYVLETLALCAGNKKETARQLGISRKALYEKLARWGDLTDDGDVYATREMDTTDLPPADEPPDG